MSQLQGPLLCPELGSSLAIHMVLKVFTAWKGAIASVGSVTVSEMNGCAFFLSLKCLMILPIMSIKLIRNEDHKDLFIFS